MKRIYLKIPLLFAALTASCSHSIHQVYLSSQDVLPERIKTEWITVEKSDLVILGFATQTDYVDNAYKDLESKCSGRVSQVSTEHLTSYQFLSYKQRVILKGLCTKV